MISESGGKDDLIYNPSLSTIHIAREVLERVLSILKLRRWYPSTPGRERLICASISEGVGNECFL
jgi:hypothetical protein